MSKKLEQIMSRLAVVRAIFFVITALAMLATLGLVVANRMELLPPSLHLSMALTFVMLTALLLALAISNMQTRIRKELEQKKTERFTRKKKA